jgi:hypothetical protein
MRFFSPKRGDERVRRGFVFYMRIQREIRILEWLHWKEVYELRHSDEDYRWIPVHFITKEEYKKVKNG